MRSNGTGGAGRQDEKEVAAAAEDNLLALPPTAVRPRREDAHGLVVVGLGGSAGSIPALEAFLQSIPAPADDDGQHKHQDTHNTAYVVVLHLSPEHESHLAQLLSRSTHLPVQQVTDAVRIEPDHVYVIPPGRHLAMRDSRLYLTDLEPGERGTRVAIDTFFRTLAEAHGPQSVAVVLSGTGADGTLGLRQVKEAGGLAIAQAPGEAQFDGMPRSAIAGGMVDYVLPAAAMPAQIASYWETSRRMLMPREAAPSPEQRVEGDDQEAALAGILDQVRAQTGHDFALYKRATVLRRIGRRMQVNRLQTMPSYRDFVGSHPAEVGDLVSDLLISVTQFFRDRETWEALERDILPPLFNKKREGDEVRAWVCGSATGEEAYTLGMLLLEQAGRMPRPPRVQVFATDMDSEAIARARGGVYPDTIEGDVSPDRLQHWFFRQNGQSGPYQVRQELREAVLFATHDVLRDTPFSRLDLVTCRNLLIYLNRDAQERVFQTFHFALKPDGRLLLGPSESTDASADLFALTDKQHRLFVRRAVTRGDGTPPPSAGGVTGINSVLASAASFESGPSPIRRTLLTRDLPGRDGRDGTASAAPAVQPPLLPPPARPVSGGRELLLTLLERYGPPTALVDEAHDIVHLSNGAGRFLQVADGEPTRNLLQLVHPALRIELRTALFAATEGGDQTRVVPLTAVPAVPGDGAPETIPVPPAVRLTVRPVASPDQDSLYFLVQFEIVALESSAASPEAAATFLPAASDAAAASADLARQLEEENALLQRQLRSTTEQYEAMTEELKASNEELQAINEELRSAGEELETSKEEMQSVNEELTTVNHELKVRVEETIQTNSDLQNFLASTEIGTIFLDRDLRIKRYTPAAESLFNLIPLDAGRPLSHITHKLQYAELQDDARQVLARLTPVEREVPTDDGKRHLLARLLPYRSLDDRIQGVVLNFVDITERKRMEKARFFLASIVESSEDAVITVDFDGTITSWNRAAESLYGYSDAEAIGRPVAILSLPEDLAEVLRKIDDVQHSRKVIQFDSVRINKDGREMILEVVMSPVKDAEEAVIGVSIIARDITERKRAEEAQRESEARLTLAASVSGFGFHDYDLRNGKLFWSAELKAMHGLAPDAPIEPADFGKYIHPDDRERIEQAARAALDGGGTGEFEQEYRIVLADTGETRWLYNRSRTAFEGTGGTRAAIRNTGIVVDVTERKHAEEALRESETRFRTLSDAVPQLIWTNSGTGEANYFNRRWYEYSGLTYEQSAVRGWQAIVHPDDASVSAERWRQALAAGEVFDTEYRLRRHDGVYRWFIGRNVPLRSETGSVVGWFGSATDVEDMKQAGEALRSSEERFRLLVEGARDYAMFLLDAEGRITFWSAGAERVLGWRDKEALGRSSDFIFTPEDRAQEIHEQEIKTAQQEGQALDRRWHVRRDGTRFWADGLLMRLDEENGNLRGFAKVMRDATEEKRAEEAIRQANEELEIRVEDRTQELDRMSRMRQELLRQVVTVQEEERGRISRDLHDDTGQLVSALLLGLEHLRTHSSLAADPGFQEQVDHLQSMADEVAQKSHRLSFTLRPTDLDDIGLPGALRNFAEQWSHWSGLPVDVQHVGLETETGEPVRLPREVETTIYRVAQEALTNILRHAVRKPEDRENREDRAGTGDDGKRWATRVTILLQMQGRGAEVVTTIEDDGPGFDLEAVQSLPPGQRRLGLFGMQERARLAGGTLTIESEPGEGTTVFLRLPILRSGLPLAGEG